MRPGSPTVPTPPVASGRPSCSPVSPGHYLGTSQDDGFLQVLQHEGQHGGREGHGVSAVDDHEPVVLPVVSLWGCSKLRPDSSRGQAPSWGQAASWSPTPSGKKKETIPNAEGGNQGGTGGILVTSGPEDTLWEASLYLESHPSMLSPTPRTASFPDTSNCMRDMA